MVSFTRTAIVNSSLPRFTATMFDSFSVYGSLFAGMSQVTKCDARIFHSVENNFTGFKTNTFHYCFVLSILAFAIVSLFRDIKLGRRRIVQMDNCP
jgi:hypothetical protein